MCRSLRRRGCLCRCDCCCCCCCCCCCRVLLLLNRLFAAGPCCSWWFWFSALVAPSTASSSRYCRVVMPSLLLPGSDRREGENACTRPETVSTTCRTMSCLFISSEQSVMASTNNVSKAKSRPSCQLVANASGNGAVCGWIDRQPFEFCSFQMTYNRRCRGFLRETCPHGRHGAQQP